MEWKAFPMYNIIADVKTNFKAVAGRYMYAVRFITLGEWLCIM